MLIKHKDLTGEYEDRNFIVTRGDSRIAITLPRNEHTARLGRENKFLIDDPNASGKLAYALTKPFKAGHLYNSEDGIYKFVLQEVNSTDDDNDELGIADYYKYFPREDSNSTENPEQDDAQEACDEAERPETNKEVWL